MVVYIIDHYGFKFYFACEIISIYFHDIVDSHTCICMRAFRSTWFHPSYCGVRVAQSLVFCVVLCRSLFVFCSFCLFLPLRRGLLDTTLCDEVCQWLATDQLVSPGTPVSSINKTDYHNIAEILLKMALSTITLTLTTFFFAMVLSMLLWFTASGYTFLYLQTCLSHHFSWYQILSIENSPHIMLKYLTVL